MIYYGNSDKLKNQNTGFVKCFVAHEKYREQIEQLVDYFKNSTEIKYKIINKYELICLSVKSSDYCFAIIAGLQYIENHNLDNIYIINSKGEIQDNSINFENKSISEQISEKIKNNIQKYEENNPFLEN